MVSNDIESFRKQSPSIYSIQAIEETQLLQIRYNAFQEMVHEIPKLERFLELFWRIISEPYNEESF